MLNEKPDYQAQDPDKRPTSTGPLPYLKTELKLVKLNADEVRVKVVNHKGTTVVNRKVSTNQVLKIDWGFSDDVKDQIVSHSYTIFLMNDDKQILSRITLNADTDGTFFVNGQKKGRL
jgi:ribosomal protein S4E